MTTFSIHPWSTTVLHLLLLSPSSIVRPHASLGWASTASCKTNWVQYCTVYSYLWVFDVGSSFMYGIILYCTYFLSLNEDHVAYPVFSGIVQDISFCKNDHFVKYYYVKTGIIVNLIVQYSSGGCNLCTVCKVILILIFW